MKIVVSEDGSGKMLHFAASVEDHEKVISSLTKVEVKSSIARLRKGNRLLSDEAAKASLFASAALGRMREQELSVVVLSLAGILADRHSLRGMDAIQLASAFTARDASSSASIRFISSDIELLDAAKKEGFDIWNPCD